MNKLIFIICFLHIAAISGISQKVQNSNFEKRLSSLLDHSVQEITVQDLANATTTYILLDARELEEYNASHIPQAKHIGYEKINWELISQIAPDESIVVYCSVGYRSEKVAKKLEERLSLIHI